MKSILLILLILSGFNLCSQSCPFSIAYGGNQFDEIKSLSVINRNTYVLGNTYSTNLPITNGLINDTLSGDYDCFITKFDSCGIKVWSTYFGGTGYESGERIESTKDGNLLICGYTNSQNLSTINSFQPNNDGSYDCFLTKISSTGHIIWSTYFGGTGGDFAFDIKVDSLDNIILGGMTISNNLYTTTNSFQSTQHGNTDAFIARFSKDGYLKWSTFYGGSGSEDIHALTIDNNFNIIGVGASFSNNLNTSLSAYQSYNDGSADVYILKLDSSGNRIFSTYFGGSSLDDAYGVCCDKFNNIYVSGHTNSPDFDTLNPIQVNINGGLDSYLSKWSSNGNLLKSTLFGGSGDDRCLRLLDKSNGVILYLESNSTNLLSQYPLTGNYDLYISTFDYNFIQTFGTYYGGSSSETGWDIRYSNNEIIFCGESSSTNYPSSNMVNPSDGVLTKLSSNIIVSSYEKTKFNGGVYPNPFIDYLSNDTKENIQISSILGDILYSGSAKYINTKDYSIGIYLITIDSKTELFIKE